MKLSKEQYDALPEPVKGLYKADGQGAYVLNGEAGDLKEIRETERNAALAEAKKAQEESDAKAKKASEDKLRVEREKADKAWKEQLQALRDQQERQIRETKAMYENRITELEGQTDDGSKSEAMNLRLQLEEITAKLQGKKPEELTSQNATLQQQLEEIMKKTEAESQARQDLEAKLAAEKDAARGRAAVDQVLNEFRKKGGLPTAEDLIKVNLERLGIRDSDGALKTPNGDSEDLFDSTNYLESLAKDKPFLFKPSTGAGADKSTPSEPDPPSGKVVRDSHSAWASFLTEGDDS